MFRSHLNVSLLLCLTAFATVEATPIQIDVYYEKDLAFGATDPSDAISVQAFLDTSSLLGVGIEDIAVDRFDLQFSTRAGTPNTRGQDLTHQTAPIIPGNRGVMAQFDNGTFEFFYEFTPMGMLGLPIEPAASFNGERIFLGKNGAGKLTLFDTLVFCSSCKVNYEQVGDVVITRIGGSQQTPGIPAPPSLLLVATALVGLVVSKRPV